jgi:carbohydrate-selective porin OprB
LLLGAGLNYRGLIPGRAADSASIGWLNGKVSKYVPATTAEQVIEVNYQVVLNRYLAITPDFQYVLNPSGYVGSSGLPNAIVFGVQISVTL